MQNKDLLLHEGERLDDLQRDGLKIIQNPDKFCFGMDAVLLSSFIEVRKDGRVMDLCTGTGIIPLLLSSKTEAGQIDALEIQKDQAEMAERSVTWNHLREQIHIFQGDVKTASTQFGKGVYDVVSVNPPYMNDNHGLKNPYLPVAIARHEVLCTLEDVIRESRNLLVPKGHFFMIHRPFRLAEIISVMQKYQLEPKRLRFVHPYIDKEPNMVLIEGVRNGRSMVKVEPPLIVYETAGKYTQELLDLYGF